MSEPTAEIVTRLWTPQGFREDEWHTAESAEARAGSPRSILPLQVFLDLDPEVAKIRTGSTWRTSAACRPR